MEINKLNMIKKIIYLMPIFICFLGCEESSDSRILEKKEEVLQEKKDLAIKNQNVIQVYNQSFNWSSNILKDCGIQIKKNKKQILIEELIESDFPKLEDKIKELSVMFADTSNTSFLISQLGVKTDSILDDKVFEGFSQKDLYQMTTLRDKDKLEKGDNIIFQVSNLFGTKTGGLIFMVTHCWIGNVKKEWMSAFTWDEEKSKYQIYLAIGLDEGNDLSIEFSKDGFENR
jgi:hypothetical protein